jgi:SAM-dependent methyltransferase
MYAKFPYPSPQPRGRKLKELSTLLKLFCTETGYDLKGKSVLDVGTGTGQRLLEAAATFKGTRFTAVDVSETPLTIARQAAANEGLGNVDFRLADLIAGGGGLGVFDVVLSMGVIHHLSDPAAGLRNLALNLADDGFLFIYIYGRHGGRERMRRKQIVSLLLNGSRDFNRGITLIKELGFDTFDYGWNLDFDDQESRDALIVDAYLNVNERLFDVDSIFDLVRGSGLDRFLIYGVTLEKSGALFDTRLTKSRGLMTTDVSARLASETAQAAYETLSLPDKYRVFDQLFQPNGYTLMAFKESAHRLIPAGRIEANSLAVAEI